MTRAMTRAASDPDTAGPADGHDDSATIRIRLDELLADRGMTLTELSERVGITIVNLSILKNDHARAIRFSTLARLCDALHCQPGDLLTYEPAYPRRSRPVHDHGRSSA